MFNQKNESAVTACATDLQTVVALGSDTMGAGDDQLGRVLMKSFLYTLTQLHCQPEAMVLYNSAVKMAEEGAESVEDLRKLEEQGIRILVCGTCLNYFELTDRLAAGRVSNMYEIAETLHAAGSVIRP